MQEKATTIASLYEAYEKDKKLPEGQTAVQGWVRTNRDSGSIGFISLNDGTCFDNLQLVYDDKLENHDVASHLLTGTCIRAVGEIKESIGAKQPFEMKVSSIKVLGECATDYPLQKKRHSFEYLREIAHLRPRANTFLALYRVRSTLALGIHEYFQSHGFVYVHTPEITGNDAEGAGQTFTIATNDDEGKLSVTDFYGKPTHLTVSGQLHVEAFAMAFNKVYTFGPTFRAEKSNTPRHASEFWMIEPEMCFADLDDDMDVIEDCIKFCIDYVFKRCPKEMDFFDKMIAPGLKDKLNHVLKTPFRRMTYTEAIDILQKAVKDGHKFEVSDIYWGLDLQSEHERYLTEQVVGGPMFLTDFPKEIKAFYMRENDDGKTVAACDCLVPGEGEITGGSQREERLDVLTKKMEKAGNLKELDWYLDTRRYGGCVHSGFGIGFDRLLMYLTGVTNIRDSEPFPRTSSNIKF